MKEISFAVTGASVKTQRTPQRISLAAMNSVTPRISLVGIIQGCAPVAESGRSPFTVETMLRINSLQLWTNNFDPAIEEVLNDIAVYRWYVCLYSGASCPPVHSIIVGVGIFSRSLFRPGSYWPKPAQPFVSSGFCTKAVR